MLSAKTTVIRWATWDEWITGYPRTGTAGTHYGVDPGDSNMKWLQGLNAAGDTKAELTADATADTTYNGDLIELGFFMDLGDDRAVGGSGANADSASTTMFKGTWTPITSKTTIGQNFGDEDNDGDLYTIDNIQTGEFSFKTQFTNEAGADNDNTKAQTNPQGGDANGGDEERISTDTPNNLSTNVQALYDAAASGSPLIGIRFYDIDRGGGGGISKANNGDTRYNTIMDAAWVWPSDDAGSLNMKLHETNGNVNDSVVFEFDNTSARSTNTSKIGTGDNQLVDDDYVATITYQDGSTALNLADGGIGSTILSGFDGSGAIYGANNANVLTIHSATGNDGAEAFLHSGDYYNASGGTAATDLTIIKTGGGTQVLTGNLKLADSSPSNESAYVSIEGGSIEFDAASGKTQIIEYLKGSTGTVILDNSGRADQTLELGFAQSHSAANATFSGAVTLQGSNTKNTIKVSTGTTSDDYANEQVLSGVISGGEVLVKDGVGILTLEGNNANTGGVEINNGTLKVGNSANNADVGSGTVTINKGKFEVLAGDTIANQIVGGTDDTNKSVLGGDGTIAALTVGSANGEVDVVSPGQGISSSLTETTGLSNQQVTLGTSSAAAAMGNLTITNLTVNDGAIFDWEISDFNSGANQSAFNDEFDVLRFDQLTVESGSSGLLNIFSVASNGTAGAVAGFGLHSGDNGILFLDQIANNHSKVDSNLGLSSGSWQMVDWFAVDESAYNFYNGNAHGDWNVWYNGSGDFYLRYTAAPEPSTYIMITGLLMLPGFRMFRRFMKKAKSEDSSVDA